jgi:hypothetical protein
MRTCSESAAFPCPADPGDRVAARTRQTRAYWRGISIRVARGERLYALYLLAPCLRLGPGELLGLRREDIDLETGTFEVVQTLQPIGGALCFARPKTEGSARTVPLPRLCIDALHKHCRQQFAEQAAQMGTYIDSRPSPAQTVPMMSKRVPGRQPAVESSYYCGEPGCKHTGRGTYPPICPLHSIPMKKRVSRRRKGR